MRAQVQVQAKRCSIWRDGTWSPSGGDVRWRVPGRRVTVGLARPPDTGDGSLLGAHPPTLVILPHPRPTSRPRGEATPKRAAGRGSAFSAAHQAM